MIIEPLSRDNVTVVARLSVELWRDCDLQEQEKYYRNILNDDTATCYLVRLEEEYVGFIELALRADYVEGSASSPTAYMEGIYVKAENRHMGIGRELIKVAEQWARSHGMSQLASDAEASNLQSINFHKASAFQEVNRIVCFIKDIK